MTKQSLSLITFIVISYLSFSQTNIDSLLNSPHLSSGEEKMEAYNNICQHYYGQDLDTCLVYIDSLLRYAETQEDHYWQSSALMLKGKVYREKSKFDEAITIYKKSVESAVLAQDPTQLGKAHTTLGFCYFFVNSFDSALNHFIHANDILTLTGDSADLMNVMAGFTNCYLKTRNFEKALEYQINAAKWSLANERMNNYALSLANMGLTYTYMGRNNEAIDSYRKALQVDEDEVKVQRDQLYTMLGSAFYLNGQYDSTLYYYEKAIPMYEKRGDQYHKCITMHNMANVYLKKGNPGKALQILPQCIDIAHELESDVLLKDFYKTLVTARIETGDREKTLETFRNYIVQKDSIFNKQLSDKLIEMQEKYDSELKDKENIALQKDLELVQSEADLNRLFVWLLVVTSALLISLIIYGFYYFRNKRLTDKMNLQLAEREKQNILLENKARKAEEQRLNDVLFAEKQVNKLQSEKLEQSRKSLHSTSLQIIKQNQRFQTLKLMVKDIDWKHENNRETATDMLIYLDQSLDCEMKWVEFRHEFDESYPGFIDTLSAKYTMLTDRELQLLAMVRTNLTSRQIADIFCIEEESVKKSRSRIIKKMGIELKTTLYDYLCKM